MRTQVNSPTFTQVGGQAAQRPPIHQSQANLSNQTSRGGSVGAAYVWQHNRDQADMRIVSISYSILLGKLGSFMLSALRNLSGEATTAVFAMFSIPLEATSSLSMSSQSTDSAGNLITTTLHRNLPAGEGDGYLLQTRSDGVRKATYLRQNNTGTYSAEHGGQRRALMQRVESRCWAGTRSWGGVLSRVLPWCAFLTILASISWRTINW